ncbi:MAG: hypothetical protein E3J86_06175 [Candidatus Thorarchaeota archaeon]|nr:MAG: hypothetical protein E3J86_06175 [Candidatus Thorarchaeota archaeon]
MLFVILGKTLRSRPIVLCLILTLILNTNIQSHHVAVITSSSNYMTSSDIVLPVWMQDLQEHDPIEILSDADFEDQGWPGNGSESNPFIIENLLIRSEYTSIMIRNTTKHFEVRRCHLTRPDSVLGGGPAVSFRNVTNGHAINNIINGTAYGLLIRNSTGVVVTDNTVYDTMFSGVEVDWAQEVLIANNTIHHSVSGIALYETTDLTIRDNRVYRCHTGVFLTDVHSSNILGNTIWRNILGLDLAIGNSIITNNSIYWNAEFGIRVSTGIASNMVYGNRIGWNGVHNAEDNSNSTGWDDGLGTGNSWNDYNGTGQYPVPGSSAGLDRWPLVLVDNAAPVVDQPLDMDFEFGSKGLMLRWNTSDEFPNSYQIMVNGLWVEEGTWIDQTITFLLDDLQNGTHTLRLRLWDAQGNYAESYVSVHVSEAEPPMISNPPDIEYVVGGSGYNITWIPEDAYPESYGIFINGTLSESGEWNGSAILVSVDGLNAGLYNFMLVVFDDPGQNATDTVLVRVRAQTGTPPPDTLGVVLLLFGVGVVGFVITFSILYTSTPYLMRFRREDDSEDPEEIQVAIEELQEDRSETGRSV